METEPVSAQHRPDDGNSQAHSLQADSVGISAVRDYLQQLQQQICATLADIDGVADFARDEWQREAGGGGITRVLHDGRVFEQAGVAFSYIHGDQLPAPASANRPELAGRSFQAMGVSLVIHPRNPNVPTSHANVRMFVAEAEDQPPVWWFGGGYDLTPFYPQLEDIQHWHNTARAACEPFGDDVYPRYKDWCDRYFYLRHRDETRGVGGLFYDDLNEWSFATCFDFMRRSATVICRPIRQSCGDAWSRTTTSSSARFNSTAVAVMSSSTCCMIAAPCLVCSPVAAPNPSSCRCRRWRAGTTTGSPMQTAARRCCIAVSSHATGLTRNLCSASMV